jgi:hypothetical protein
MPAKIHFQEVQKRGVDMTFNQIAIEMAVREREREMRESVRRNRLLRGDGTDPEVDLAAASARTERRLRRIYPVPGVTP